MNDVIASITERAKRYGKSLYDLYPELRDRVPIMRISSEDEAAAGISGTYQLDALNYGRHQWLKKAIKVWSDNISPLQVRVVQGEGGEQETLYDHEISELLAAPNPEMDSAHFWQEWCVDMALAGEWGIELVKNEKKTRVLEMYPRQAPYFFPRKGAFGTRYRKVSQYKIDDHEGPEYLLEPGEFIHYKFYNPLNVYRGLAPISAVRMSITIDQLSQAWSRLFLKNNMRPDFAFIAPEGLTSKERKEYMEGFRKRHTGERAHEPIILEDGVTDIKMLGWAPKDLEWVEQRKLARDEIAAVFGVPDEVMGYGKDTYENIANARIMLWTLTLVPLIRFRDSVLAHFFKIHKQLLPGQRIATDLSEITELQEDKTKKTEQFHKLVSLTVPPNVANELLKLGLPALEGGDVGYIPVSYVPVTEIRPRRSSRSARDLPLQLSEGDNKNVPEYGSARHEAIWKSFEARLHEHIQIMQREVKKYFQRQQIDVLQALRSQRTFGRGKFKDEDGESIPPVDDIFDLQSEIDLFVEIFEENVARALEASAVYELDELGSMVVFDIESPEAQAAISHILNTVATKTNETTWNDLNDLFWQAESEGVGISEIQERLNAYYEGRKSDYQTERTARTTMGAAANKGAMEGWAQSEVIQDKSWISALLPDRTRDAHAAAHGQTVGIRESFLVDGEFLEYPLDPNGSAGNIINCLCTHIAKIRSE